MPTGHRYDDESSLPTTVVDACAGSRLWRGAASTRLAHVSAPDAYPPPPPAGEQPALDADYVAGAIDLLGVLAYGELTTYQSLAVHAYAAPDLAGKVALCRYAAADFEHVRRLEERIVELGSTLEQAMEPFTAVIDDLNRRTRAETWLEGLVKATVADGIIADFYAEMARLVDPRTRLVVEEVVADDAKSEHLVRVVRESTTAGSPEASRLSLWGRRLVGEALTQAQQLAADREAMGSLLVGTAERPGADLGEIGAILRRVTARHTERMVRMGLTA